MTNEGTRLIARTVGYVHERLRHKQATVTLQQRWIEEAKKIIHKCVDSNPEEWWDSDTINARAFIWALEDQINISEQKERDIASWENPLLNQHSAFSSDAHTTEPSRQ